MGYAEARTEKRKLFLLRVCAAIRCHNNPSAVLLDQWQPILIGIVTQKEFRQMFNLKLWVVLFVCGFDDSRQSLAKAGIEEQFQAASDSPSQ